jgi:hypothetical protein
MIGTRLNSTPARNSRLKFSYVYHDFSFPLQKSNRRLMYTMAEPPFLDLVEAKIIELHLGHHTQDQIVAFLRTRKPRVSRCIRAFHRSGVIPNALRIGGPSKNYMNSPPSSRRLLCTAGGYRRQNWSLKSQISSGLRFLRQSPPTRSCSWLKPSGIACPAVLPTIKWDD